MLAGITEPVSQQDKALRDRVHTQVSNYLYISQLNYNIADTSMIETSYIQSHVLCV